MEVLFGFVSLFPDMCTGKLQVKCSFSNFAPVPDEACHGRGHLFALKTPTLMARTGGKRWWLKELGG